MNTKAYRYAIVALGLSRLISSCTQDRDLPLPPNDTPSPTQVEATKKIVPIVDIPSHTLEWDESYRIPRTYPRFSQNGELRSFSSNGGRLSAENESYEFVNLNKMNHIGKIYPAQGISTLSFRDAPFTSKHTEDITITFMFPGYYSETLRPSTSTIMAALTKATKQEDFSGEQSAGFEYDFRAFSCYDELKLAFGANVDIASAFKIDAEVNTQKIKSRTGFFARVFQRYFDVIMDYPEDGNVFKDNSLIKTYAHLDPVYVSTGTFGRMALLTVESNYSYEEVRKAFKAMVSAKVVNGTLQFNSQYNKIMEESKVSLIVTAGQGSEVAKTYYDISNFKDFLIKGAEFNAKRHGAMIFFTANHVSDNSMFRAKFRMLKF